MDNDQQIPVPPPDMNSVKVSIEKPKLTTYEFFLWIGVIISLYSSISAFLNIYFRVLNKSMPDSLDAGSYYSYTSQGLGIASLSTPLSILIITFPIFILLTYLINKYLTKNPEKTSVGFRKFVIYLTIFLSCAMIITDLIVLLRYFLNGEITNRFILKVLGVLVTGVLVGSYYFFDLKRDSSNKNSSTKIIGTISIVLAMGMVILPFFVFGNPKQARELNFDQQRVNVLNDLDRDVVDYWQRHGFMPKNTDEVLNFNQYNQKNKYFDPDIKSNNKIEYFYTSGTSYKLCATFSLEVNNEDNPNKHYLDYANFGIHESGYVCFDRNIDPIQFPVDNQVENI